MRLNRFLASAFLASPALLALDTMLLFFIHTPAPEAEG